ncbi:hypothetical protein B0H13DRAFT_1893422 [Mycena leptocephala]|nr:hypothetical protein B0H13DRAFT_1893422 [Mycena leptocephala]
MSEDNGSEPGDEQLTILSTPLGDPDLAEYYEVLGELTDTVNVSAVKGSESRDEQLTVLSVSEIIETMKQVISETPLGDLDITNYYEALAVAFEQRFDESEGLEDLDAAILNKEKAVDLRQMDRRRDGILDAEHLESLEASLQHRFRRLDNPQDLKAALQAKKEAQDLKHIRTTFSHTMKVSLIKRTESDDEQSIEISVGLGDDRNPEASYFPGNFRGSTYRRIP